MQQSIKLYWVIGEVRGTIRTIFCIYLKVTKGFFLFGLTFYSLNKRRKKVSSLPRFATESLLLLTQKQVEKLRKLQDSKSILEKGMHNTHFHTGMNRESKKMVDCTIRAVCLSFHCTLHVAYITRDKSSVLHLPFLTFFTSLMEALHIHTNLYKHTYTADSVHQYPLK